MPSPETLRAFDNIPVLEDKMYDSYCEKFKTAFSENSPKAYIEDIAKIACDQLIDEKSKENYQDTRNRVVAFIGAVNHVVVTRSTIFIEQNPETLRFMSKITRDYAEWGENIMRRRLKMPPLEKLPKKLDESDSDESDDNEFIRIPKPTVPTKQSANNTSANFRAATAFGGMAALLAFGVFCLSKQDGGVSASNNMENAPDGFRPPKFF